MNANDYGLAVLHIATGVFFVTTGGRKCLLPDVRAKVCALFDSHGVPKPMQYMVMAGELAGGTGLLFGFLTHLAAAGLALIMAGAYILDTWAGVEAKQDWTRDINGRVIRPASWSKLISNALCTPEAQLLIIVVTLTLTGAGAFSLDHLLFG